MKRAIWLIYGGLWFVFSLFGWLLSISTQNGSQIISATFDFLIVLIYLMALFGYLFDKMFFVRKFWRFVFWWIMVAVVVKWTIFLAFPDGVFEAFLGTFLIIPFAYSIYKYSSSDNPLWDNVLISEKIKSMSLLFEESDFLEASIVVVGDDGDKLKKISIKKLADGFVVESGLIVDGDEVEKLIFNNLDLAIRYIEETTPIRAGDFHAVTQSV